jgi:hypothetical protein
MALGAAVESGSGRPGYFGTDRRIALEVSIRHVPGPMCAGLGLMQKRIP